jgi:hypothetical protein
MRESHQGPRFFERLNEWPDIWKQSDLVQATDRCCNGGWVHIGKEPKSRNPSPLMTLNGKDRID